jgi:hypothetical protein
MEWNANSMFIYNNDVYITGSYGSSYLDAHYCYWINGQERIDLNIPETVNGIYIEQK